MAAISAILVTLGSVGFVKWFGRALLVGAGFSILQVGGLLGFVDQIRNFIQSSVVGLGGDLIGVLGIVNLDLYVNWVFLGFSVKVGMGLLSKLVPGGGVK